MNSQKIDSILKKFPFYISFIEGKIDKKLFLENMIAFQPDLMKEGLTEDEYTYAISREGITLKEYTKMFNKIGKKFYAKYLPPDA